MAVGKRPALKYCGPIKSASRAPMPVSMVSIGCSYFNDKGVLIVGNLQAGNDFEEGRAAAQDRQQKWGFLGPDDNPISQFGIPLSPANPSYFQMPATDQKIGDKSGLKVTK